MAQSNVKPLILKTFNSASLTSSYAAVNPLGLDGAVFNLFIINDGSTPVTISYDGVTDHDYLPDIATRIIDFQNNAQPMSMLALLKKGTVIYVKGTAGTGTIAISGFYV